jgi:predicted phosphoribosyltransferase
MQSRAEVVVAFPPKSDSLAHRQGKNPLPLGLARGGAPLAHGVDALLDE